MLPFACAALAFAGCLFAQGTLVPLTVLHTNDLHAHLQPDDKGFGGFAYVAGVVRDQREHCMACIYLNAGDLVQGTPVSTMFKGFPVYQIADRMGIDVSTVGNHEFDYGWKQVLNFVKLSKFPVISANLEREGGELLTGKGIRDQERRRLAGSRDRRDHGRSKGKLLHARNRLVLGNVVPVLDAVRKTVSLIRGQADVIIVLGHIHDDETNAILREIPEVALVVAGHDHKGYTEMKHYAGRFAVEAKSYGVEVGRVDLKIDSATKKVASAEWTRIPVDSKKVTPAPEVAELVTKWELKVSKLVDVPVGEAKHRIERPELRKLVEQAMAEETGADIAWINTGNVRDAIPQGTILARAIWNALPFDNRIVIGTFKGSELPVAITRDFSVEPDRTYKVAVTDFTAANQGSSDQLSATGLKFPQTAQLQRDAMLNWVKKKKSLGQ